MLLLNGDCIEEMKKLIDDGVQVDSVVTDPPYHLTSIVERFGKEGSAPVKDKDGAFQRQSVGFMGKEWDGGDIAFQPETWELALKLLKPGGHLLAFSGSRTYHRMAVAIEDAGFDIRDQIMWLYGSGFPKSLNIGKSVDKKLGNERIKTGQTKTHSNKGMPQAEERTPIGAGAFGQEVEEEITVGTSEWEGWGTALKPAHEPIVLARKSLSENSIVANVLKHRTGGIHIDACRIEGKDNPVKWTKPRGGIWKTDSDAKAKLVENKKGRFPSNVMHDGSDVVKDIFPKSKGFVSNGNAPVGEHSKGNIKPMRRGNAVSYGDDGSAARYFYCPKTSKSEKGNDNTHPTVKPIKLMKYLCRLVTPKGGTVLDPFMGSGSTGIAAKDEGFEFIGIEREKEYFEIAERRVSVASPLEEFMK
jgi:site-specific DNA-methyltransferase (adenine-specific)